MPPFNSTKSKIETGVAVIVAVAVAGLMAALVLPVAIDELVAVNTSNWSSGAASLFNILDLIFILVIFLVAIGWAVRVFST